MAVFLGIEPGQLEAASKPCLVISAMDVATKEQHSVRFEFPGRGGGVRLPGIGSI